MESLNIAAAAAEHVVRATDYVAAAGAEAWAGLQPQFRWAVPLERPAVRRFAIESDAACVWFRLLSYAAATNVISFRTIQSGHNIFDSGL